MALPSLAKTWRFATNLVVPAGASTDETQRYVYGAIYFALLGKDPAGSALSWTDSAGAGASAPTALWIPRSTCDSAAAGNNDDVDRLTVPLTDFVRGQIFMGSPQAHSWYDVENSAIGIHLISPFFTSTTTNLVEGWLVSLVGSGTDFGGANGTTTARPTAIDQHRIWTSGPAAFTGATSFIGVPPIANAHKLHVMASSDGEVWRIVVFRNGFSVFSLFIGKPQDPVVLAGAPTHTWNGADKPYVGIALGADADGASNRVLQFANWHGTNNRLRSHMGQSGGTTLNTPTDNTMSCERMATGTDLEGHRRGVSLLDDNRPFLPIGIWGESGGFIGRAGVMSDIWMGNDTDQGVSEGDNYPDDLSRQFVAVSNFILPWNGTVMQTT